LALVDIVGENCCSGALANAEEYSVPVNGNSGISFAGVVCVSGENLMPKFFGRFALILLVFLYFFFPYVRFVHYIYIICTLCTLLPAGPSR
jgi:hypothetical protein